MNYLFPYKLVPRGSKIVIYGAGEVGKDFYLQLNQLDNISKSNKSTYSDEKFYHIKAWVDRAFDGYEVNPPFDYVKNVNKYDFDYIIIAVVRPNMAESIKKDLKQMGIPESKIVWSRSYYNVGHELFPTNKVFLLKNFGFVMDLLNEYWSAEAIFGREKFYQSFQELGIEGKRVTGERIALYHIRDFLTKDDTVLDIGCNCGFFSMQVAPYVKKIVGYEIEPKFVNIANKVSNFLNIDNVEIRCANFLERKEEETYNAVFSFAVHYWLIEMGFSEEEFIDLMYNLLKDEGYLFFDSHAISGGKRDYNTQYQRLCSMFIDKGMKVRLYQNYKSDFERDITVFQKVG